MRRRGAVFGRRIQQVSLFVLDQVQIAFVLAQHVRADFVLREVLDVVTGPAVGKEGDDFAKSRSRFVALRGGQRVEGRDGAGLDAHSIAEIAPPLQWDDQCQLPLRFGLNPA